MGEALGRSGRLRIHPRFAIERSRGDCHGLTVSKLWHYHRYSFLILPVALSEPFHEFALFQSDHDCARYYREASKRPTDDQAGSHAPAQHFTEVPEVNRV